MKFCIAGARAHRVRNLGFEAARASAYGLPADEALKAVTIYPAEILGITDRLGTLEVGKGRDADGNGWRSVGDYYVGD